MLQEICVQGFVRAGVMFSAWQHLPLEHPEWAINIVVVICHLFQIYWAANYAVCEDA